MKLNHAGLSVLLLCALAAACFLLLRSPAATPQQPATAGVAEALTPDKQTARGEAPSRSEDLQVLTQRLRALQREVDSLKRRGNPAAAAASADEDLSVANDPMQQEMERTQQLTTFLETRYVGEAKDPTWSLQAEQQVSAAFVDEQVAAGSQLQQIACQQTLCRIESNHHDPSAERAFISRLGRLSAFGDAEAFSRRVEHADGSVQTLTFVSRSGHTLPRME
jgi:hypothetical protein